MDTIITTRMVTVVIMVIVALMVRAAPNGSGDSDSQRKGSGIGNTRGRTSLWLAHLNYINLVRQLTGLAKRVFDTCLFHHAELAELCLHALARTNTHTHTHTHTHIHIHTHTHTHYNTHRHVHVYETSVCASYSVLHSAACVHGRPSAACSCVASSLLHEHANVIRNGSEGKGCRSGRTHVDEGIRAMSRSKVQILCRGKIAFCLRHFVCHMASAICLL